MRRLKDCPGFTVKKGMHLTTIRNLIPAFACAALFTSTRLFAVEPCDNKAATMNAALSSYQAAMETAVTKATKDEESQIQDEPQPSSPLNGKFIVKYSNRDIYIPNIEFKMAERKISLKTPMVTIEQKEIIFDFVGVRMVNKVVGKRPVATCGWSTTRTLGIEHRTYKCTTRMQDIITAVPEVYREKKKIVLGMPTVAMRAKELTVSIPETKMTERKIVIKMPEFTLTEFNINAPPSADEREEMERDAAKKNARIEEAISLAQAEAKQKITVPITDYFECLRKSLTTQRDAIKASFDASIAQADAAVALLAAQGAGDAVQASEYKVLSTDLKLQAQEQLKKFDEQIAVIGETEEALLKSLTDGSA